MLKGKPTRFLRIKSDHIAEYHADTLQHGSTIEYDTLRLLPIDKKHMSGVVKITCRCDELPKPQTMEIPISTEWKTEEKE